VSFPCCQGGIFLFTGESSLCVVLGECLMWMPHLGIIGRMLQRSSLRYFCSHPAYPCAIHTSHQKDCFASLTFHFECRGASSCMRHRRLQFNPGLSYSWPARPRFASSFLTASRVEPCCTSMVAGFGVCGLGLHCILLEVWGFGKNISAAVRRKRTNEKLIFAWGWNFVKRYLGKKPYCRMVSLP